MVIRTPGCGWRCPDAACGAARCRPLLWPVASALALAGRRLRGVESRLGALATGQGRLYGRPHRLRDGGVLRAETATGTAARGGHGRHPRLELRVRLDLLGL